MARTFGGGKTAIYAAIFVVAGLINLIALHFLSQELTAAPTDAPLIRPHTSRWSYHAGQTSLRQNTAVAVLFPSLPGDRSIAALRWVLHHLGYEVVFCVDSITDCLVKQNKQADVKLIWVKREGKGLPARILESKYAVNVMSKGWQIWSRRNLCLAMQRQLLGAEYDDLQRSWHPKCLTLPSAPKRIADLMSRNRDSIWVHHQERTKDVIFKAGDHVLDSASTGVIEQYITNPLLLNGFKFSVMVYVLVTSLSPICAYIYEDAEVHLSPARYSSGQETIMDPKVHRTAGGKVLTVWGGNGLMSMLQSNGADTHALWRSIRSAVRAAVIAAGRIPSSHDPAAGGGAGPENSREGGGGGGDGPEHFKLLAADVVVDSDYKPWVVKLDPSPRLPLERSAAAAAAGGGGVDLSPASRLRVRMLEDLMSLLGLPGGGGGDGGGGGGAAAADTLSAGGLEATVRRCVVDGMGASAAVAGAVGAAAAVAAGGGGGRVRGKESAAAAAWWRRGLETIVRVEREARGGRGSGWGSVVYATRADGGGAAGGAGAGADNGGRRAEAMLEWWIGFGRARCGDLQLQV